jgi:hypothetical protein
MKIWQCFDNLANQNWSYTSSHNLKFQSASMFLVLVHLDVISWLLTVISPDECLDLTNGDKTNGNQLQVFQCFQGNTNQVWTV